MYRGKGAVDMSFSYNPLWKLLIDKGYKKTDLRALTGIGTATLAKLSKNENVSMEVLDKLCKALDCGLEDIVVYIPEDKED